MGKKLDLTGQKFGRLTAIKIVGKTKQHSIIWECRCDCGNITNVVTGDLKSGHTKSCGCLHLDTIDLAGRKFGRLTVIKQDTTKIGKGAYWLCRCDCGNEKSVKAYVLTKGITKSCGCLNKEINSRPKEILDMIGKRFGYLTVIERAGTHITNGGQKKPLWLCRCDCGNETTVVSQDLKDGHTKSCGCIPTKRRGDGLIDLSGKQFGKLIVLERVDDYVCKSLKYGIFRSPSWKCLCDCGNIITVQGGNLRNGNTTNCGCNRIKSKGEELVANFLTNNCIRYIREYSFDDLRNEYGNLLRFDFAILNNDNNLIMLIEYQGKQHYVDCGEFGEYQRKYSDPEKQRYCKNHDIPLYEIKYNEDLQNALYDMLNKIKQYTKTKNLNLYVNPVPSFNN